MVGELKLTADQKKKIAEIQKEMRDKRTAMTPEDRRTKRAELQQERQTKIDALLTPEQKENIDKYKKDHPTPGRGPARP